MIQIDMQMPKNCADCCFATADLVNGIITLFCMTQAGRRLYAPDLISRKDRPKWCPLKKQETVEGHWIPIESPTGVEAFGIKEMTVQVVRCSVCDAEEDVSFAAYRFCPRCGAKMEGR